MSALEIHSMARRLLGRARSQGRLAHAYLIAGPEGAGKRTLARDFARSLLCDRGSFPGCGECGPCQRVAKDQHPDLHWVEPEGRFVKIDSIRRLCSSLTLHSFEGGMKVGVVAEAEKMTVEAQNAFLKTLEEPPSDTVLALTTNSLNRLLPTTQSRCQIIRVGPMPAGPLAELVAAARSLPADQAKLLAALARGNARRALDLDLTLVTGFRKKLITALLSLKPNDRLAILRFADDAAKSGHDPQTIMELLLEFYRDVMLAGLGLEELTNLDLAEAVAAEAARDRSPAVIAKMQTIHQAMLRAGGNANPRLNLEILTMALAGVDGAEITPT